MSLVDADESEYRLVSHEERLALIIPLERYQYDSSEQNTDLERKRAVHAGDIVLLFDRDYFAKSVVTSLVDRYVTSSSSGPYLFAIVSDESETSPVLSSISNYAEFSSSGSVDGMVNLTKWGGSEIIFFGDLIPPPGFEDSLDPPKSIDTLSYRLKDLIVKQWFELSRSRIAERSRNDTSGDPPDSSSRDWSVDGRLATQTRAAAIRPAGITLYVWHRAGSIDRHFRIIRNRRLIVGYAVLACFATAAIVYNLLYRRARQLRTREHEFIATVTHELRTPVAAVQAAGDNLAEGVVTDPARVQSYGKAVLTHGRRLRTIIDQILLYAGLSKSENRSRPEPIDLSDAVGNAVSNHSGYGAERLIVHIEQNLPPTCIDSFAIETIIDNLLSNAIKHTDNRTTITLNVYRELGDARGGKRGGKPDGKRGGQRGRRLTHARRGARSDSPGNSQRIVIRVSDTGGGIPRNEIKRVREPFFRGAVSKRNQISGSGLGLSLVNRIVYTLGGRYTIVSVVGRGTIVTVKIPATFVESS